MNKIMRVVRKVKKMVEVEVEEESFGLELSKPQLYFIKRVLEMVGGDPIFSPRKYERQISSEIEKVLRYKDFSFANDPERSSGFYFKDDSLQQFEEECNR